MSWQEVVLIVAGSILGLYLIVFVLILGTFRSFSKKIDREFDRF